ncbi:MAG TPA: hypothetical protein DCP69_04480 [Candidatus Omnitrophica bacterium]|nr:hypothetical protein [Candidatus Omnitrophota bacterium]
MTIEEAWKAVLNTYGRTAHGDPVAALRAFALAVLEDAFQVDMVPSPNWGRPSEHTMAEPTTYRGWQEFYHRARYGKAPGRKAQAAILKRAAQRCIEWLYDPTPDDIGWHASPRIKAYGMDQDAINWGDLRVVEATLRTTWIEEASPDAVHLQRFLHDRLARWGWEVAVVTEW